jgi:integrase
LQKLTLNDINDMGSIITVKIPDSKTNKPRSFVISGKIRCFNFVEMYRKYASLRPQSTNHTRFFIRYFNGKCSVQPVGVNTFGKIPSDIAKYLNIENPMQYTGHCFRRSSATLLVESGASMLTLKRHGGWKSSTVAEGYIEESISKKTEIATQILEGEPSTNTGNFTTIRKRVLNEEPETSTSKNENKIQKITGNEVCPSVTIVNCSNCDIKIEINSKKVNN